MIKGAVRPMSVVVLDVDPQRTLEMALATMSSRSRHSRRRLPNQRSIIAFARGARTGVRRIRTPSERNTSSKGAVVMGNENDVCHLACAQIEHADDELSKPGS
jgi:hypothetical protein